MQASRCKLPREYNGFLCSRQRRLPGGAAFFTPSFRRRPRHQPAEVFSTFRSFGLLPWPTAGKAKAAHKYLLLGYQKCRNGFQPRHRRIRHALGRGWKRLLQSELSFGRLFLWSCLRCRSRLLRLPPSPQCLVERDPIDSQVADALHVSLFCKEEGPLSRQDIQEIRLP